MGLYKRRAAVLKVIVVGQYAVGKTSLCRRYAEDKFESDYKMTIGVDVITRVTKIPPVGDIVPNMGYGRPRAIQSIVTILF